VWVSGEAPVADNPPRWLKHNEWATLQRRVLP
jgi:hypothetical protein